MTQEISGFEIAQMAQTPRGFRRLCHLVIRDQVDPFLASKTLASVSGPSPWRSRVLRRLLREALQQYKALPEHRKRRACTAIAGLVQLMIAVGTHRDIPLFIHLLLDYPGAIGTEAAYFFTTLGWAPPEIADRLIENITRHPEAATPVMESLLALMGRESVRKALLAALRADTESGAAKIFIRAAHETFEAEKPDSDDIACLVSLCQREDTVHDAMAILHQTGSLSQQKQAIINIARKSPANLALKIINSLRRFGPLPPEAVPLIIRVIRYGEGYLLTDLVGMGSKGFWASLFVGKDSDFRYAINNTSPIYLQQVVASIPSRRVVLMFHRNPRAAERFCMAVEKADSASLPVWKGICAIGL